MISLTFGAPEKGEGRRDEGLAGPGMEPFAAIRAGCFGPQTHSTTVLPSLEFSGVVICSCGWSTEPLDWKNAVGAAAEHRRVFQ